MRKNAPRMWIMQISTTASCQIPWKEELISHCLSFCLLNGTCTRRSDKVNVSELKSNNFSRGQLIELFWFFLWRGCDNQQYTPDSVYMCLTDFPKDACRFGNFNSRNLWFFYFALMAAACKSYLARNGENFLLHVSFNLSFGYLNISIIKLANVSQRNIYLGKNERKTGEFHDSMTIDNSPLVA